METRFLVIFAFLFFQRFGTSTITSSNVTCLQAERHSLLKFKKTLTDIDGYLSTWSGVECCEWQGVGCDLRNGHVVKLDLPAKWLEGKLSPSLQNLKHLRYLDISGNGFSGNIPEFLGSFQCLEYLDLSMTDYVGVIPHHLGNLSRLQYLDLSKGIHYLTSTKFLILDDMGWVSSLSSLRHLNLTSTKIGEHVDWFHPVNMLPSLLTLSLAETGINIPSVKLSNLSSINSLTLSLNSINSTIPVWLSNLTSLMHLNLHQNYFHGKIPDLLCNLSSLIGLDLSYNILSGPIPACLGRFLSLEDLDLSHNQLNGNIPMSLGELSKLKNLDISRNSMVGVLSETHFVKLKNLNSLDLSYNSLSMNIGSQWIVPFQLNTFLASTNNIGPHFPNWLQTQTNLRSLDMSNSGIRDTIPEWFENIITNINDLDLSNNQISGKLPRLHLKSNGFVKMNSNKFEGSLVAFPSHVTILDLSDNLLSGHVPQTDGTMNPSLSVVDLSDNHFTGSIPVHLCKVSSIVVLDLSKNRFTGRLPGCVGNLMNLHVIDVANNNITGVVPSSLGSLRYLNSLHLHNNKFEGDIPVSLQNLTNMVTMDLGNNLFMGSIPFWIGEKLSNLKILNLQQNKLIGKIPLQLCQLNALQYLSLARNNLTGTIPHCFRNLSGMMITTFGYDSFEYEIYYTENILASMKGRELLYTTTMKFLTSLDLSHNNIVGEIPNALMYLVGLKNLNLSWNLITGQIPVIIGDLKQLESLDLSKNKLSGSIPQSLAGLYSLSCLNMSFNNLSGPIPVGNQIQTLDDLSIYEGNNGLCGPPVSKSCNVNDVTSNHVGEDEDQNDNAGLWFYEGMGPGFVVGFVGLLGSLHFIRSWRLAYFKMLEKVYGWLTISLLLIFARLQRKLFE